MIHALGNHVGVVQLGGAGLLAHAAEERELGRVGEPGARADELVGQGGGAGFEEEVEELGEGFVDLGVVVLDEAAYGVSLWFGGVGSWLGSLERLLSVVTWYIISRSLSFWRLLLPYGWKI